MKKKQAKQIVTKPQTGQENDVQAKDIRVLIVDDSSFIRSALKKILSGRYTLAEAEDGEVAVEQFHEFQPDIIVLDLNMPRMGGMEVINYLRKNAKDEDVFILVLTAEESTYQKTLALELGANDYLVKPFVREELLARVRVAERQARLLRQLRSAYAEIEAEVDEIAALQKKLLPDKCPVIPGLKVQTLFLPSGHGSGDYYDYLPLTERAIRMVIADVSGHGARAAFIMGVVRTLFRMSATEGMDLAQTMRMINAHLTDMIGQEDDFVTAFVLDLNLDEGCVCYVNAGHCPGLILPPDGKLQKLPPTQTLLGFFDLDFEVKRLELTGKTRMFLFTDGFYEWEVSPEELLGMDRFMKMVEDCIKSKKFNITSLLSELGASATGMPTFRDDLTAMGIEMEP